MAAGGREVLPGFIKPVNYDISIFDIELGGSFGYQGSVKIDFKLSKPTKEIVLNSLELKIHSAEAAGQKATIISYNELAQRATLTFASEISRDSALEIKFSGTVNNTMAGFYRSRYKPVVPAAASVPRDEEYHYMFSTQFQSCDARRAFPCFDEPNIKATFDVEIEIPNDQTALSNMPEKGARPGKGGRKIVSFEKTPLMSTYLLAWACGDFEYVEDFTKRKYDGKPLPVRVYTTRGLKEQGRFGLENAHKIVDYFSEIFKIDYPLPKADLLAVHEFSHNAMENWGLVTYRTTAILFDEKQSDAKYKNKVAYVVAHELAHQWFGNLVTMDWWNALWLNEGFATWVGWYAVDYLYPEWDVWAQFVSEAVQSGFGMDSLRSSHPIEVPVGNALEIDQIFDAISYLKGSSVIRMLSAHLGQEVFLQGVSNYLKAHSYGNATTEDLWAALSKASGKDINSYMDPWIKKIGFPVITITEEPGQISIRQSRFLTTGDIKPDEDGTLWWVPLGLRTGSQTAGSSATALTIKEETIRDVDETFYKFNAGMNGFYRTNYPPERLAKLGAARAKLSVRDRVGLVGDAAALAVAGEGTTAGLLSLCAEFKDETSHLVWSQVLNSLGAVRSVFATNPLISVGLEKFILQLVTPAVEKIGWKFDPEEGLRTGQLRSLLIGSAGGAGHAATIAEAQKQFKAFAKGDVNAINRSLRFAVFSLAIETGGAAEYEAVKQYYLSTTSVDGKEVGLRALGRVQTPELAKDVLNFQFSEKVSIQDKHFPAEVLAANSKARNTLWRYIQENWDAVHEQLAGNPVIIGQYIKFSLQKFADHDIEKEIEEFFESKDTNAYARGLATAIDTVRRNANYKDRDENLVLEWLKAHGFA